MDRKKAIREQEQKYNLPSYSELEQEWQKICRNRKVACISRRKPRAR